jgi:uncharacterized protein YbdZ (MbtH family)
MNPIDWLSRILRAHRRPARETHRIIVNESGEEFVVWPSTQSLPPRWHYVGESGSEEEMQLEVLKFAAETSPAPLLVKADKAKSTQR